jgi:hypothetical protein
MLYTVAEVDVVFLVLSDIGTASFIVLNFFAMCSVNYLEFTERFCELSWNSQSSSVNCRGIHRTKKK